MGGNNRDSDFRHLDMDRNHAEDADLKGVVRMLNAEKFKEEIAATNHDFALVGNKVVKCTITTCDGCSFKIGCRSEAIKWLISEYEEPKIEPEVYNLKCDDKVEVSNNGVHWNRRYLKRISGDSVVTWCGGTTSFSADDDDDVTEWAYARIPRKE